MTPGLAGGPPWPDGAKQGSVVAVAGLGNESVPVFVGVCKIDISSLGRVQGTKGAAVEGVTWYGDEIWNWSQTSSGGRQAPTRIEGWDAVVNGLAEDVDKLDIDDEDDGDEDQQGDGGVALEAFRSDLQSAQHSNGHSLEGGDVRTNEPEHEPTTAQIDQAFYEAFLYSLYNARKKRFAPKLRPRPPRTAISADISHDPATSSLPIISLHYQKDLVEERQEIHQVSGQADHNQIKRSPRRGDGHP